MSEHVAGYADYLRDVWNKYDGSPERAQERHDERTQMVHHQVGEPFTDGRKVGWVKTEALLPYREYDRRGAEAHEDSHERIDAIKDDIKPGGPGWTDPISLSYHHDSHRALVDEGNHRLQAALEAGVSHVPVTVNRTSSTDRRGRDPYRLALWGRSQVRTQPDKHDYVPGQMHPHEVMPDHMLHESSRRPDGFVNWPPEKLRETTPEGDPKPPNRLKSDDLQAITDLLRPVHGGLASENYYLATGGGKYHRINPVTGQSRCRGTVLCDRESTPLIVSNDQTRVHPMVCLRCLPDDHPARAHLGSKTAASHKLVHGDYEVGAVHQGSGGEAWAYHTPTGKRIADMHWGNKHTATGCPDGDKWCANHDHFTPNTILGMGVHPDHRRQGVATAMLAAARGAGATVLHSTDRSDAGDAWARSVGGDVPERASSPDAWFRDPETGQHLAAATTIDYLHNTQRAPDLGGQYGQDIEPHGRYLIEGKPHEGLDSRWEHGQVTFHNPLHVEYSGWKRRLSQEHGGLTGRALSDALVAKGHDGIITHDGKYGTAEIVDLRGLRSVAAAQEGLPDGWTHEPGKEGSAIKSIYRHADTGTSVYFPKREQYHPGVHLPEEDEAAYIPHVHNAVQKTGEHNVTFMVDTGHDKYFKATKSQPQGRAGGYVSGDDPDTVRISPHFVRSDIARGVAQHAEHNVGYFTPSIAHTDYREYTAAHELGHVHDFRNQHINEERRPGSGVFNKTRASEASFYGQQKSTQNLSRYGGTNTAEGYAEAYAHHYLRHDDDESPATKVAERYSGRYDWNPRKDA